MFSQNITAHAIIKICFICLEFKKDTDVKKPSKTTECSVAVSSDKSTASSSKTTVSKEQPKPITEIKTFEFAGEKVRYA
jgi:hypothetical protein